MKNIVHPLRGLSLAVTVLAWLAVLAGLAQMGLLAKDSFFTTPVIVVSAADAAAAGEYEGYDPDYEDEYAYDYSRDGDEYLTPEDTGIAAPEEKTLGVRMLEMIGSVQGIAFIVMVLALIGFFTAGLMWVWRAHNNMVVHGIRLKTTPVRAVVNYFIPLLNLVLPFEAMRELVNRSEGEPEELANSSVSDVTAWWTAVAVGLMIFAMLIVKYYINYTTPLTFLTPLWMEFVIVTFALILLLGSTLLFAGLLRRVTKAQETMLPELEPDVVENETPVKRGVTLIKNQP